VNGGCSSGCPCRAPFYCPETGFKVVFSTGELFTYREIAPGVYQGTFVVVEEIVR